MTDDPFDGSKLLINNYFMFTTDALKLSAFVAASIVLSSSLTYGGEPAPADKNSDFTCSLNSDPKVKITDLIDFSPKHESQFKLRTDEDSFEFFRVGTIKSGKCRDGTLYVVQYTEFTCGKESGEPDQVFADDGQYTPAERIKLPECQSVFRVVELPTRIVIIGARSSDHLSTETLDEIRKRFSGKSIARDNVSDWIKLFLPSDELHLAHSQVKIKRSEFQSSDYAELIKNDLPLIHQLKVLAQLPAGGKLYQDGRHVLLETPDNVVTGDFDLGLYLHPSKDDFSFLTFWDDFKTANHLFEKDLVTNAADKSLTLNTASPLFKKSYDLYLRRLKAVDWESYRPRVEKSAPLSFKEFVDH